MPFSTPFLRLDKMSSPLGIAPKLRMPWSVCAGVGYSNRVDRRAKATQGYEKGGFELLLGGVREAAATKNAVRLDLYRILWRPGDSRANSLRDVPASHS
jgi:hypothetical protein